MREWQQSPTTINLPNSDNQATNQWIKQYANENYLKSLSNNIIKIKDQYQTFQKLHAESRTQNWYVNEQPPLTERQSLPSQFSQKNNWVSDYIVSSDKFNVNDITKRKNSNLQRQSFRNNLQVQDISGYVPSCKILREKSQRNLNPLSPQYDVPFGIMMQKEKQKYLNKDQERYLRSNDIPGAQPKQLKLTKYEQLTGQISDKKNNYQWYKYTTSPEELLQGKQNNQSLPRLTEDDFQIEKSYQSLKLRELNTCRNKSGHIATHTVFQNPKIEYFQKTLDSSQSKDSKQNLFSQSYEKKEIFSRNAKSVMKAS